MIFNDTKEGFRHLSNWQLLHTYWTFSIIRSKRVQKILYSINKTAATLRVPLFFISNTLYNHFFCGRTLDGSIQVIRNLARRHIYTVVHFSFNPNKVHKTHDKIYDHILESIEFAQTHLKVKAISCKISGIGNSSVLEKIQQEIELSDSEKEEYELIQFRVNEINTKAKKYGISIYWDSEKRNIQRVVDQIIIQQMGKQNTDEAVVYITLHIFDNKRFEFIKSQTEQAKNNNYIFGVKLIKGLERIKDDTTTTKESTYSIYEKSIEYCIDNIDVVALCIASHSENHNEFAYNLLQERNIQLDHPHVWFSQIYGMSDHISNNLANLGCNVHKYTPYGRKRNVIPYVLRWAEDSSLSNDEYNVEIVALKKEILRRSIEANK
ncbi:MAG: proline dehydrogenase family protein [Flavobacteriales bacterium]|nr:proline dehydrogenase family protein [Flavobacteriales bacterium]